MIELSGHLTVSEYRAIVYGNEKFVIAKNAEKKVRENRTIIDGILASGKTVYGINTGFGNLASVRISDNELDALQYNLIRSHSTGFGESAPREIVRGTLLLRLNSLLQGVSGIRFGSLEILAAALDKDLHIYIPRYGSLGASGDLAPLAHCILALLGEGEILVNGARVPSGEVLAEKGIKPMTLKAKEGLALINGTPYMTAWFLDALFSGGNLIAWADIIGGFTVENLKGTLTPFLPENHAVRPHRGQVKSAETILRLFRNSPIIESHRTCEKVQDAYSLRCIPQVHGAVRNAYGDALRVAETEMNSVTDNPLIFAADRIHSQGNFHGEILALYGDFIAIALSELGAISERRLERLLNPALSCLPAFLTDNAGLNSGLMIVQYTAAALASNNKTLATPSSVDSIPVSANQEDHVSMGANAVIRLKTIIDNLYGILASELLADIFARRFHTEGFAPITEWLMAKTAEFMPNSFDDHPFYRDIEKLVSFMKNSSTMDDLECNFGALTPQSPQ